MGIASRRDHTRHVSLVGRLRTRIVQMTAAGALIGCLYGGFTLAPAAASLATAHVSNASHAAQASTGKSVCGAVPFPC
jgi:hypothetical protein